MLAVLVCVACDDTHRKPLKSLRDIDTRAGAGRGQARNRRCRCEGRPSLAVSDLISQFLRYLLRTRLPVASGRGCARSFVSARLSAALIFISICSASVRPQIDSRRRRFSSDLILLEINSSSLLSSNVHECRTRPTVATTERTNFKLRNFHLRFAPFAAMLSGNLREITEMISRVLQSVHTQLLSPAWLSARMVGRSSVEIRRVAAGAAISNGK